jgi:hypothetical protein
MQSTKRQQRTGTELRIGQQGGLSLSSNDSNSKEKLGVPIHQSSFTESTTHYQISPQRRAKEDRSRDGPSVDEGRLCSLQRTRTESIFLQPHDSAMTALLTF